MNPLATLQSEQWMLHRFLGLLRTLVADAGFVGPCRAELEIAAEFLDEFGAALHDAREDRVLFPLLIERGLDDDSRGRPLVHDHQAFREQRDALRRAIDANTPAGLEEAVRHAHGLATLLEEHLEVERALQAVLQRRLSADDVSELERRLHAAFPDAEDTLERARTLLARLDTSAEGPASASA